MPREEKARVLSETEFKRVLKVAAADRHSARNVALLYMSFGLGLRVKEIGALSVTDVLEGEGQLRTEINLHRRMTKGGKQRHAYLSNPRVRQAPGGLPGGTPARPQTSVRPGRGPVSVQ